ncbi:unnamed protein product [Psylliodes chrysocephalus]|uniref:Uncharacterized protein n=1 Tax=Psylliodes chrysocephalus TaxID=3402493 RepID=A0A9P0CQQ2_9CUCU|nr:unnamed protein product [Psylliodes chrysocephala]
MTLLEKLKRANLMSQQSVADADVDIVLKAIETAFGSHKNKVVIVSEDTDVLTMLAARTPPNLEVFLLKPPSSKVPDVVYSSESLACFHVMRHELSNFISREIQAWYGSQYQDETLDPLDWGWDLVGGELSPVTMTQEAGPEKILINISYFCETDCARIEFGIP